MKKSFTFILALAVLTLMSKAQDINPYLVDCQILPKPLMPVEFNGTGVVSLIVGNSGGDDMNYVPNQELKLTITLSYGVPNAANPLDAVGGTWSGFFNWSYSAVDNTFYAVQKQDIPSQVGGVSGSITILYRVNENSKISNMNNGFAVNIVPPAYAIYNNVLDDSASEFTNVEAYDYGDAPASYGVAVHMIDIYKSGGVYKNYMYLGNSVDPEASYQASAGADGDDNNQTGGLGVNDEDGVTFPKMVPGTTVNIPVALTLWDYDPDDAPLVMSLRGWIDWDKSGAFAATSERVINFDFLEYLQDEAVEAWSGPQTLVVNFPVTIPANAAGSYFARFRLGPAVTPTAAASFGEVEDYQFTIDAPSGEVTGHLYLDVNGNGSQDVGEPDLADIDVTVTDSTNGVFVVTSDASGNWSVTVYPGSTLVAVDESDSDFPPGCVLTQGINPATVTVVNGATADVGSHGYFIPVRIGDCVWLDDNGDGVRNAGEPGVSNVTVRLLDDASALVAETTTDANGDYHFGNRPPATYRLAFVPPADYAFTVEGVDSPEAPVHSDVSQDTGMSPLIPVDFGDTNLTVNAGVYMPAFLFGYLFIDENVSLVRDLGDTVITNAAVTLYVNGAWVDTVNTDTNGYYSFADTPVGAVSIIVSRAYSVLVDVPADGEAAADERRNRGLPGDDDTAYIEYAITSGYGVLAAQAGEPLNFGFTEHPLSTEITLKVYAAANGEVVIELSTVNENGNSAIEIYAKIDGAWSLVAAVPSEQIVGFGSNLYRVQASGLVPGESYLFRVVDESGHIFESPLIQVALALIAVERVTLTPEMVKVTFTTEYGMMYQVMVCENLGREWRVEYVQHPTAQGWSALSNEPFMAGPGDKTEVLVPRNNRTQAFFKIVEMR